MLRWMHLLLFGLCLPVAALAATVAADAGVTSGSVAVQAPPPIIDAQHHLLTIRLRPAGETLRVILALDGPAAYTVRADAEHRKIQIDLINVHTDFLPPELGQIGDARLDGIWLASQQAGLSTLELRLPSTAINVEHFALQDPPAIILDLARSDIPLASLRVQPREFKPGEGAPAIPVMPATATQTSSALTLSAEPALPQPQETPAGVVLQKGGSAVPLGWLEEPARAHANPEAAHPSTALAHATSESLGTKAINVAEKTGTENEPTSGGQQEEIHPINRDFNDFPVHKLDVVGPEPKEIRNAFLNRQWAEVVSGSLQYLHDKRINQDTVPVLYMLAEARYQMGNARQQMPLGDMVNFYQQAVRMDGSGELGAFGGLRLGQMMLEMQDLGGALRMAEMAVGGIDPPVRRRGMLLMARIQAAGNRTAESLRTLAAFKTEPGLSKDQQLEAALLEGNLRQKQGDTPGAWQAFQTANTLDPGWVSLYPAAGEQMARTALAAGQAEEARRQLEYINRTFSFHDDSQKVNLALLYAQALEQLGDDKTAEATYALLLNELGDSPKGREVQKLMLERHPDELLDSEGRYAELLYRKGSLREAMAELHRAQQQGIRNGLDTRGLEPLMEKIVPPFMAEAIEDRRPFDAVQAWRLYGGKLRDVAVRNRCQRPLATALASLGLNREAMEIIKRLKQAGMEDPGLARIEAEMLLEQGDAAKAVELLEPLASARQDAERAATLRLLARANERLNRPLAAAQALQALARTPGLEPDELGETLMRAGNLFTRQGMPVQAIELGLQGLVYEREQAKRSPTAGWKPTVGNGLVLMLARAYATRNDIGRSALVLNALLARPWLTPEQTAEARWMLARADAQLGRQKESAATLTQLIKDEKTPALWRAAATDAQALHTWDEKNPSWAMNPVAASGP